MRAAIEPIAIIGIGCRFPGKVTNAETLWSLLCNAGDAIGPIPADRWDVEKFHSPDPEEPGKMYAREGGYLSEKDTFDPKFFGISPREARFIDPQQRLFMEVSWEALENACQSVNGLYGTSVGVFVGMSTVDYLCLVAAHLPMEELDAAAGTGLTLSPVAGRISYAFGFTGPSMVIDTACSSSLVALHGACESLRRGECNLALAGGVNVILSPLSNIILSRARMLSVDGRCKTFDASADGYGRSEGAGVVVLKRLSDALAENDNIFAQVVSSAVNQDGPSGGLTVPNGPAQQSVIKRALEIGGVSTCEMDYIEAHGTGTAQGDPIEMGALNAVFSSGRDQDNPLWVGSLKTNLGHMEASAGIAGIIKVILQMKNEEIAPHLHLVNPTPHIPWDEIPIKVPTQRVPWPKGERRRLAGVNSFGFSGTNAHVVLEEAPDIKPMPDDYQIDRPLHLLTMAAKNNASLKSIVRNYHDELVKHVDLDIADVCFSANAGRCHFDHRIAITASSREDATEKLDEILRGWENDDNSTIHETDEEEARIAFLFTGQGSQYVGMSRELYKTQPFFRAEIDKCEELLAPLLKRRLRSLIWGKDNGCLGQTENTQPVLFALEYCLAQLWGSWGITPSVVMGHSVGEYPAACFAGAFSLEDGLKLITARGRLMQTLPSGGHMLAVFADTEWVSEIATPFAREVAVAAFNAPRQVVLSGESLALDKIETQCAAADVNTRRLDVSYAFHSPMMEPILEEFSSVANEVEYRCPELAIVSNVLGVLANDQMRSAEYWVRHVREPVQFMQGMNTLAKTEYNVFLEIGPNPVLLGMGRQCVSITDADWLPSMCQGKTDWEQLLDSLRRLYERGAQVHWAAFDTGYRRQKVELPTYPFQRQKYWCLDIQHEKKIFWHHDASIHPLLGRRMEIAAFQQDEHLYESEIDVTYPSYLQDHRVYETVIFPAAGYIEMALNAAITTTGAPTAVQLSEVIFKEPLIIMDNETRKLQTVLTLSSNGQYEFRIFSAVGTNDSVDLPWTLHVSGKLSPCEASFLGSGCDKDMLIEKGADNISVEELYDRYDKWGLQYGPQFRGLTRLWNKGDTTYAEITLPKDLKWDDGSYVVHPVLLDAAFQTLGVSPTTIHNSEVYLPIGFDRIRAIPNSYTNMFCQTQIRERKHADGNILVADVRLIDITGQVILNVDGLKLRRARPDSLLQSAKRKMDEWFYKVAWKKQPKGAQAGDDCGDILSYRWLVFANCDRSIESLAKKFQENGQRCEFVFADTHSEELVDLGSRGYSINPDKPEHFTELMQRIRSDSLLNDSTDLKGIIYLWSTDAVHLQLSDAQETGNKAIFSCCSALHLVQALSGVNWPKPPQLWLVTQGAQVVGSETASVDVPHSALWGLGRVIAWEMPGHQCRLLDLDPDIGVDVVQHSIAAILQEILFPDNESQIAYRQNERYVARLERLHVNEFGTRDPVAAYPFQVRVDDEGTLEGLTLESVERRAPGINEVEVEVRAAGVNFKDVLHALGLLRSNAEQMGLVWDEDYPLGFECAGVVSAIGDNVSNVKIGDPVIVQSMGCLRSHVTTDVTSITPKPQRLSFEQAASMPTVFLTSYYALNVLADIKPGDKVLIHAGAGGVGQAAIQLARLAGAEVYATASPAKWEFLKSQGVKHVMNSRTLDYADEVMRLTDGRGVDIVLNSLSGEFIEKNLQILADNGRYVDIGKLGIWDSARVSNVRPDVTYYTFDLSEVDNDVTNSFSSIISKILQRIEVGELEPLPIKVFSIQDVAGAFRYLAQAKNIGKVIVKVPSQSHASDPSEHSAPIRDDRSYLITGGLGALGQQVAEWLVQCGARHIVLTSHRVKPDGCAEMIKHLEDEGANVSVIQVDVSQRQEVAELFRSIERVAPPLTGVFHAAGVLDDGVLVEQNAKRFARVMEPKVQGAWHLHVLSQEMNRGEALDMFVCFSSVSALLGSPGQSNYAAANVFLDALVQYRQHKGLAGTSINWGPWAEAGMAAALEQHSRSRLTAMGMTPIMAHEGLSALEYVLATSTVQTGVMKVDWGKFINQFAGQPIPPLLAAFDKGQVSGLKQSAGLNTEQLRNLGKEDRRSVLITHLRAELAKVLGFSSPEQIGSRRKLFDLGIDSLMAVELKNRLESSLKCTLPNTILFDYPTLDALVDYLLEDVFVVSDQAFTGSEQDIRDSNNLEDNEVGSSVVQPELMH